MRTVFMMLLAGCTGPTGPAGPIGPTGPIGATGPTGETPSPPPQLLRTVVVSPAGTPPQNGAALRSALAGITASSAEPWLLKIEPGFYDLGSTPLAMKSFVDVEGSGETVTTIGGAVDGANAQLRFLTVANSGGGATIHAASASGFSLSHVTVAADGDALSQAVVIESAGFLEADNLAVFVSGNGSANHLGLSCLSLAGGAPTCILQDSTITVSGGGSGTLTGVRTAGGNLVLDSVEVTVSGTSGNVSGVSVEDGGANGGNGRLQNMVVEVSCTGCGLTTALAVLNGTGDADAHAWSSRFRAAGGTTNDAVLAQKVGAGAVSAAIADCELGGAIAATGGAIFSCIGNYDSTFAAVTCP